MLPWWVYPSLPCYPGTLVGIYLPVHTVLYHPGYTIPPCTTGYTDTCCPRCGRRTAWALSGDIPWVRDYEAHSTLLLPKECDTSLRRNLPLSRGQTDERLDRRRGNPGISPMVWSCCAGWSPFPSAIRSLRNGEKRRAVRDGE